MEWRVAQAKQHLSQLLDAAAAEPQLIFNRDRLVAAVIDPREFEAFRSWKEQRAAPLLEGFRTLQSICSEESYSLEVPLRQDRTNPFAGPETHAAR